MKKSVFAVMMLVLSVAVMAFPGLPSSTGALIGAKNYGTQQDSLNNLRQIFAGINMYIAANDDILPPDFTALASYVGSSRIFVAAFDKKSKPASGNEIKPRNTSFAYIGNLGRINALKNPAVVPLAFEKPWLLPASQRRIAVLYADGRVESLHLPPSTPKSCRAVVKFLSKKITDKNLKNKLNKNAAAEDAKK